MEHEDAVSLIRSGVGAAGETWADLGAGSGVFTRALSELLGPAGTVVAVDRDARVLQNVHRFRAPNADIRLYHADFSRPLELSGLDGLLLANSLHFVKAQAQVLRQLVSYLRPHGRVLLVEYGETRASPWNPYPVPPERFKKLAAAAGLEKTRELGRRPSRFRGRELYTAVALKP